MKKVFVVFTGEIRENLLCLWISWKDKFIERVFETQQVSLKLDVNKYNVFSRFQIALQYKDPSLFLCNSLYKLNRLINIIWEFSDDHGYPFCPFIRAWQAILFCQSFERQQNLKESLWSFLNRNAHNLFIILSIHRFIELKGFRFDWIIVEALFDLTDICASKLADKIVKKYIEYTRPRILRLQTKLKDFFFSQLKVNLISDIITIMQIIIQYLSPRVAHLKNLLSINIYSRQDSVGVPNNSLINLTIWIQSRCQKIAQFNWFGYFIPNFIFFFSNMRKIMRWSSSKTADSFIF